MTSIDFNKVPSFIDDGEQDLFFTFRSEGLAEADLTVVKFEVEEALSCPYKIALTLASPQADCALSQFIDKPARLAIHDRHQPTPRYFHGIVSAAARQDQGHRLTQYQLLLEPQLHRLRYGSDCRIFQARDVVDIAMTILQENGVSYVEDRTIERHQPREYITQYHESHFDFVQRILAEEGIFYYFRHEENRHVMVLSDRSPNCPDCAGDNTLEYNATAGGRTHEHYIERFSWDTRVTVSDVSQRDHYFKKPNNLYQSFHSAGKVKGMEQALSHYNYPGRYKADKVGADFARYQLEAFRKSAATGEGRGRCQYLTAGGCFTMKEHFDSALNRRFLITKVTHEGQLLN